MTLSGGGSPPDVGLPTRGESAPTALASHGAQARFAPAEALDLSGPGQRSSTLFERWSRSGRPDRGRNRPSIQRIRIELLDRHGDPWSAPEGVGAERRLRSALPESFGGPPDVHATLLRGDPIASSRRGTSGSATRSCAVSWASPAEAVIAARPGSELIIAVRGGDEERGWFLTEPRTVVVAEGEDETVRFRAVVQAPDLATLEVELVPPRGGEDDRADSKRRAIRPLMTLESAPTYSDRVVLIDPVTREPHYAAEESARPPLEFTVPPGDYLVLVEHDPRGPATGGWGSAAVRAVAGRRNEVSIQLDAGVGAILTFDPSPSAVPEGETEVVATFELVYDDGTVVPVLRPDVDDSMGPALASGRWAAGWAAGERFPTLRVPVGAATLRATFPADASSNRVRMISLEQGVVALKSGINDWVVR